MKFIRIFPLTCASTLWPFSSSTRNIAFGSGSTTVPSTSIASSLVIALNSPAPADPVTDERPHDRESIGLDVRLDRVRHVGESTARVALPDAEIQALARDVQELQHVGRHGPDGQRERAIRVVPLYDAPEVKADDVALADLAPGRWDPVHDFLVDRDARRRREPTVALERGRGPLSMDVRLDVLV